MLFKHPRTKHAPWSECVSDDKILYNYSHFLGKRVIITEKMDGENTTGYANGVSHARSMDSKYHPSRTWFKNWWAERCFKLNTDWRICGENMFATHSIHYIDLESYFYGFGVYNSNNVLLSWDDSIRIFEELDITPVKVLCDGIFDNQLIQKLKNGMFQELLESNQFEGYVIRLADEIAYDDYSNSVMKWVRANHVQETSDHWMSKPVIPNELKG